MRNPHVAVIYYSSTGTCDQLARLVAQGAAQAGAEVRVRLVPETAPAHAIAQNADWQAFVDDHADAPRAAPADLEWADAVVFGTPTRFGSVSAQLKAFIDTLGGLWARGALADKVYAAFTSAQSTHGGREATLLGLYTSIHHFGGFIVSPGYTNKLVFAAGGNPYGVSATAHEVDPPTAAHAAYLGERVATVARRLQP